MSEDLRGGAFSTRPITLIFYTLIHEPVNLVTEELGKGV